MPVFNSRSAIWNLCHHPYSPPSSRALLLFRQGRRLGACPARQTNATPRRRRQRSDCVQGGETVQDGFVGYLRDCRGAEMTLPKRDAGPARRRRRRKLEAEMLALMKEGGKDGKAERELRKRWLSAALAYFHDLPVKAGRNVGDEDVTADESGMTVRVGGNDYWIPHPESGEGHPAP